MRTVARLPRLMLAVLVLAILAAPLSLSAPSIAHAQRRIIHPRDIALRPSDLPPGFVVIPEQTGTADVTDPKGVLLQVVMQREVTPENLLSGPIIVEQRITRLDEGAPLGEWLGKFRADRIREDGYSMVPGAPNDGGTASLGKRETIDGVEVASYLVGFIKNEMIIYTGWAGLDTVIDLRGVLTLAGVSSARYDAALSGAAPSTAAAPPPSAPAPRAGPAPAAGPAQVAPLPGAPVDARGRPLDVFVNDLVGHLDQYWSQGFAQNSRRYSAPRLQWVGQEGTVTPCSPRRVMGPGYCGQNGTIYLYVPFFAELWTSQKDFAVVTVIAHEWGHHVQVQLGIPLTGIQQELQADCLAGMFAGHGETRGYLEPGDLNEALTISWHSGDVAHGTGPQRVEWFLRGYNGSGCAP